MKLVHVLLPEDLIKRIDDFRFAHRSQSRAAAIRTLLELALDDTDDFDAALSEHRKDPSNVRPFDEYLAKRKESGIDE